MCLLLKSGCCNLTEMGLRPSGGNPRPGERPAFSTKSKSCLKVRNNDTTEMFHINTTIKYRVLQLCVTALGLWKEEAFSLPVLLIGITGNWVFRRFFCLNCLSDPGGRLSSCRRGRGEGRAPQPGAERAPGAAQAVWQLEAGCWMSPRGPTAVCWGDCGTGRRPQGP